MVLWPAPRKEPKGAHWEEGTRHIKIVTITMANKRKAHTCLLISFLHHCSHQYVSVACQAPCWPQKRANTKPGIPCTFSGDEQSPLGPRSLFTWEITSLPVQLTSAGITWPHPGIIQDPNVPLQLEVTVKDLFLPPQASPLPLQDSTSSLSAPSGFCLF